MKYTYFISYSWSTKTKSGFGNCDFTTPSLIDNIRSIRDIEKEILDLPDFKDSLYNISIVILNYQLLKTITE